MIGEVSVILVGVAIVALVFAYIFPLATVYGNSMLPTYHEGQILLCRRVLLKKHHKIQTGGVYVLKAPYTDDEVRLIIKRVSFFVHTERGREIYVLGDNPKDSLDSRMYGTINEKNVVAKVITCIMR